MESIYMSPSDAAARYHVCRKVIYDMLRMTEAPQTIKIGNRRLIPIKAMDEFVQAVFKEEKAC